MRSQIETITPTSAAVLLKGNYGNRPIITSRVVTYAAMMKRGEFYTTHQGIAISPAGRLMDGQHRLEAVIKSGCTVKLMVTRDLPEELFRWIDGGKTRSNADRLALSDNGRLNRVLCSSVRAMLQAARGRSPEKGEVGIDQIESEFLLHSEAYIVVGQRFISQTLAPGIRNSSVAAALVQYYEAQPSRAEEFMTGYLTGQNLLGGSPILALRNKFLVDKMEDYQKFWRAIWVTQQHSEGRTAVAALMAVQDWRGNVNSVEARTRAARSQKSGAKLRERNKRLREEGGAA